MISNPRFVRNHGHFRPAFTFTILLSFLVLAVISFPPRSGAKLGLSQEQKRAGKRSHSPYVAGEVLVRYRTEASAKSATTLTRVLRAEGRDLPIQVERTKAADIVPGLRLAHVPADDTLAAIETLKQQPDVLYAEPNYIWHLDATPNDPRFSELYGLTKIGAPQAWDTTTGSSSVVIGIVDEGVDINHPDLTANIWTNPMPGSITGISGDLHGYDFVNSSGTIPADEHATHVAGTAGARGNNAVGVVGVNWTVSLMSLRALDPSGGDLDDIIAAYAYAKQMRDLWASSGGTRGANIRVLNNSYGGSGFSQNAFDAISALNQSGILFVASAGNTDDGNTNNDLTPHYPSDYNLPNVICVGATNQTDALASFSHIGPNSVHLGAPGQSILSTLPANTYGTFSGTSMSSPHVSGAAALIAAANPNVALSQLKALLIFNGDISSDLVNKTITGRRLNVANSITALNENDTVPPGTVTNLHVNSQTGRNLNVGWTASGDNGASGQASLYDLSFVDSKTGAVIPLKKVVPVASGSGQTLDVKIPFRHTTGAITLREFDNVGNEGVPAAVNVAVNFADGDPYATTLGFSAALSTGGTPLAMNCDDCYKENYPLPFAFPFAGQSFSTVTISSNGNLYFSPPPKRSDPIENADDNIGSTTDLSRFKMIAGLWDDLYLKTSQRADADVYVVQPDASRIIFRWQGVPCNPSPTTGLCVFGGAPVNFEVELRNDGTIKSRYGSGNTAIFPVVGISGGEPDAYIIPTHTSEATPTNLTNAAEVTYIPRNVINPLENNFFFISQQYRDLLNREPDLGGLGFWTSDLNSCGTDPICLIRRRVEISAAFFIELEFQRTGSFVYRSFKGALGRQPNYAEFSADRPQIVEGPNLEQTKQAYMAAFVQRPEFVNRYIAETTAIPFVDKLIGTTNVTFTPAQRQALIDKYNTGTNINQSRAFATRDAIDATAFQDAEFNRAFVLMQYFGYLGRDIDQGGYDFWLDVLNNRVPGNFKAMVCAFITSPEYQRRFSNLTPHSDRECGPPAF